MLQQPASMEEAVSFFLALFEREPSTIVVFPRNIDANEFNRLVLETLNEQERIVKIEAVTTYNRTLRKK